MSRVLAIALMVLSPAAAAADTWWQGIWAWDKAWCKDAAWIGSVTPAPIAITSSEVLGYENSCRIFRADEMRALNAVQLQLECQSEGETYDESRLIMKGENSIWMWFGADEPLKFHRCPDPKPTQNWLDKG
jgi:hypothetical protein